MELSSEENRTHTTNTPYPFLCSRMPTNNLCYASMTPMAESKPTDLRIWYHARNIEQSNGLCAKTKRKEKKFLGLVTEMKVHDSLGDTISFQQFSVLQFSN